jgi:hypothetical protein
LIYAYCFSRLTEPFLKELMPTFYMSLTKKTGATFVQTTPAFVITVLLEDFNRI